MTSRYRVHDISRRLLWSTDSQPLLHPSAANAPPMCVVSPPVGASRRGKLGAPFLLYCGEATPSASVTSATCRSGQ
jgi:hypothetical protein